MKKHFLFAFASVAMMAIFAACGNDIESEFYPDGGEEETQYEIKLTSEITPSRVTDLEFHDAQIAQGQQVGVTIAGAQSEHKNVVWSVGKNGDLTNTKSPVYWGEGKATITAYHPYHADWTGTSHEFSVGTDQSAESGYANSDLLWTTATDSVSKAAVKLNFSHLLAKINVTLSSDDIDDLGGVDISICGTRISTTFDPATGTISDATGDVAEIKAGVSTKEACTASAIIVPQTIGKNTPFIKLTRGDKNYYYTLPVDVQFMSGCSYQYALNVNDSNLESPVEGEEIEW